MNRLLRAFAIATALCIASSAQEVISQSELLEHLILGENSSPAYPPLARQARIQGPVLLTVFVNEQGNINRVQLDKGHPILAPAAVRCAEGWKFRPFIRDDQPFEVQAQVTFDFKLQVPLTELESTFDRDYKWRLQRARTIFAENDPSRLSEAAFNLNQAIELAHTLRRHLEEGRARILLARISELEGRDSSKEFADALALFREAKNQGSISSSYAEWADSHFYAGRYFFRKGNYDTAEKTLSEAIQSWRMRAPESETARARFALAASMAAASNLQLNHPHQFSYHCAVFRREKNALHGLELDEATQRCPQPH